MQQKLFVLNLQHIIPQNLQNFEEYHKDLVWLIRVLFNLEINSLELWLGCLSCQVIGINRDFWGPYLIWG